MLGNASATNGVTHKTVTLNLQDPDSMTADLSGNLVMTSQADNEIVIVKNPGATNQSVTVLPLSDARKTAVSVDDSLYASGAVGSVLLTDQKTGATYQVSGSAIKKGLVLSAAVDIGQLGTIAKNGRFTPVISGFGSPRGLAFL